MSSINFYVFLVIYLLGVVSSAIIIRLQYRWFNKKMADKAEKIFYNFRDNMTKIVMEKLEELKNNNEFNEWKKEKSELDEWQKEKLEEMKKDNYAEYDSLERKSQMEKLEYLEDEERKSRK